MTVRRPQLPRRARSGRTGTSRLRERFSRDQVIEQAKLVLNRGREALGRLTPAERVELGRLVVKSRGRYRFLSRREQQRLRELVARALLRD